MPWGLSTGNDASNTPMALDKSQEMTGAIQKKGPTRLLKDLSICPTDQEAMVPVRTQEREGRSPTARRKQIDKKSWDYIIRSGIAGGIAGCAAKTVVGPLDRVKILFQASNPQFQKYTGTWSGVAIAMRDIYRGDGGMRGLFRGHSATLLRVFPYAGIKFLAYEQIRARIIPEKKYETPIRRFISGSLAGMTSVFFTYPLEIIRVRMAFETKREGRPSLSRTVKTIYTEHPPPPASNVVAMRGSANPIAATVATTSEVLQTVTPRFGLANFFRGFSATLCGMLPYAGASFLTHDTASDYLRHPSIAEFTTIPGTAGSQYSYDSSSHLPMKKSLTTAKPRNREASDPYKPPQLKAWAELSSGGLAGFVSQTVSYPLEVIRRRMQVGGVVGDGHRLGMAEVATKIFRERGWRGFFVGLGIGYVKVIPMVATSFFVYERCKWAFGI